MTMRIKLDLRPALGPARDQGPRPTCLAFAVSSAHEVSQQFTDFLSVEHLFYHGVQRSHKDPDRGLSPNSVSEALQKDGQPKETVWPYQTAITRAGWNPPLSIFPLYNRIIKFSATSISDVKTFLEQAKLPLVLLLDLSTSFYQPDAAARVLNVPHDVNTARHAVLAVGLGEDEAGSYTLIRNSWGCDWGDKGHAWLHDDYVHSRLLTVGEITDTRPLIEVKR